MDAGVKEWLARLSESQARFSEGQARVSESQARLADEQTRLSESQARFSEGQTRLAEGQTSLHAHAARTDRAIESMTKSIRDGFALVVEQFRDVAAKQAVLTAESRLHDQRLDRLSERLDRFHEDVLRGFTNTVSAHRALRSDVSLLETRVSRVEGRKPPPRRQK